MEDAEFNQSCYRRREGVATRPVRAYFSACGHIGGNTERTGHRVSVFRMLVEWKVSPDRDLPPTECRNDRDRIESIVALAAELHDLMLTDPRGDGPDVFIPNTRERR